jgi:geranylgeranyl pyrophosphate synthase
MTPRALPSLLPVVRIVADHMEDHAVLGPYVDRLTDRLQGQCAGESPQRLYQDVQTAVSASGTPLYGALTLAFADAIDAGREPAHVGGDTTDGGDAFVTLAAVALEEVRSHSVVHADVIDDPDEGGTTAPILVGDALYASTGGEPTGGNG